MSFETYKTQITIRIRAPQYELKLKNIIFVAGFSYYLGISREDGFMTGSEQHITLARDAAWQTKKLFVLYLDFKRV